MGLEKYSVASVVRRNNSITLSQQEETNSVDGAYSSPFSTRSTKCGNLIVKDAQLFSGEALEGNRVTLLTRARKCPHGVAISSSQRQLSVRQAEVSSDTCVFIDQEYHLWSFPLSAVAATVAVDKVPLLQTRRVRKISCGRSHFLALVDEIEQTELNDSLDSDEETKADDECPDCKDNRRMRISALQLEADRDAGEHDFGCSRWEVDSIASTATFCQNNRKSVLKRKKLSDLESRPKSLPLIDESPFPVPSLNTSSINPCGISISFVSMNTIEMEEKRREYEEESDDTHQNNKTNDFQVVKAMEVWAWGVNDEGQLGLGDTLFRKWPTRLVSLNHIIVDISCGDSHSSALSITGEVFFWGRNISHSSDENLFFTRPKILKLGPEQFVFRQFSSGDSTWLLLVGRELTTSLYHCGTFSEQSKGVTRIPQNEKSRIFVDFAEEEELCLLQVENSQLVRQVLVLFFRGFLLSRLTKGLLEVFDNFYSKLTNDSTKDSAAEERITILRDLCEGAKTFLKVVYSSLAEINRRFSHLSENNLVYSYSLFASSTFISSCEKLINCYGSAEAYDCIPSNNLSDDLEKTVERLALEFSVDSTSPQTTIKNLIAEILQFLTFVTSKARESLQDLEDEPLRESQKNSLKKWKTTNSMLQRVLASSKKTKKDAWSNPKLLHLRQPGRLLLEYFPMGEDNEVKSVTFVQPRFLIQPKVVAIYVFHDLLVTEETKNYKTYTRSYPLHLVWTDRVEDNVVSLKTPELQLTLEIKQDPKWFMSCCSFWIDPLMEGTPVPAKRKGNYEFSMDCPREHLRHKKYSGHWKNGQLCGKGKLEDLETGDVWDGMFDEDRLHGFGQMFQSVSSESTSSFYIESIHTDNRNFFRGIFDHGLLNGLAKIRYSDGSSFEGYVKSSKPHGFGIRKHGFTTHLGNFRDGVVSGYGVAISNKEKRLGEFADGKLNGRGTTVTIDGSVFEGEWVADKMKQGKILIIPLDGSDPLEYEGETGDRLGDIGKQGRLRVTKNSCLQGAFSGNLLRREIRVLDATLRTSLDVISPVRSMLCGNGPVLSEWAVPIKQRWTSMFDIFLCDVFTLEENGLPNINSEEAWSKIVKGMIEGKQLVHGDVSTGFCDALEKIPDFSAPFSQEYYQRVAEYWRLALDNAYHPLKRLFNGITEVLTASYSDISAHRALYDHCVLEAIYLIEEAYNVVRYLFPELPEDPWAHAPESEESVETTSSPESSPEKKSPRKSSIPVPVPCCDFICESFFSRCAPILFTVYSLHNSEREDKYWGKAVYLNAHTDVKLLTHLGVEREVWPIAISTENTRDLDRPIIVTTARDKFYRRAVDSLQRLPSETNPSAKLRILTDTYTIMEQCIAENTEVGSKHVFSADSLLPAFIYVVIRAQIRHLGTEILCLDDFSREWRGAGAIGLLFTNLQSAYLYICNEKSLV